MKTLNWGIIGAGIIAKKMAGALALTEGCHLIAVASKTAAKAQKFADEFDLRYALTYQQIVTRSDVDIIYVATTHNFHFENAKLALQHGKHVLMEKPFTVNAGQARELVQIARDKNLFLMEAIWTRFLPSVKSLKNKLKSGAIGAVKQMDISFGVFISPDYADRLKKPELAGGSTLDLGIYPISFACYLLDALPEQITSMAHLSDLGVDEVANYIFRFPPGCLATLRASYNCKMKNKAMIYGTEGMIEFHTFPFGDTYTVTRYGSSAETDEQTEIKENNHRNGFIYQVQEVVDCLSAGRLESNIIPLDETVRIMALMDAMRKDWGLVYPFE